MFNMLSNIVVGTGMRRSYQNPVTHMHYSYSQTVDHDAVHGYPPGLGPTSTFTGMECHAPDFPLVHDAYF